ncbi:MAG: F0F1 ATP synthase subunit B [Saprospiraceae bacterium]
MIDFLFLADFSVIRPDVGLLFWTTIIFLVFWFGLGKMAFTPIAQALKKREDDIQGALDEAKKAKVEMAALNAKNEELLVEARAERANILREAKEAKDSIIKEARDKAKDEAQRIVTNAKVEIENQKNAAMTELKNQVGVMAIDIAEKVIKKELAGGQDNFVNQLVNDIKLN